MAFPILLALRTKAPQSGAGTISTPSFEPWEFDRGDFIALLDSDAGSGTSPTLNVKLQTSSDGGTTWIDLTNGAFAQVTTAAIKQALQLTNAGTLCRFSATVAGTGTPSFNWGLTVAGRSSTK